LETGRSKNIYAEQTKPLIEKIDAMIDKFQLDHVKQIIDHQKKFLE
jgi:hypothetical protein